MRQMSKLFCTIFIVLLLPSTINSFLLGAPSWWGVLFVSLFGMGLVLLNS